MQVRLPEQELTVVAESVAKVEVDRAMAGLAELVRFATAGEVLAAPHSVDLEIAAALRGPVQGGKLPADEAPRALELLAAMGVRRHEHPPTAAPIDLGAAAQHVALRRRIRSVGRVAKSHAGHGGQ